MSEYTMKERIAGFLWGIGIGTAIGFFLRARGSQRETR